MVDGMALSTQYTYTFFCFCFLIKYSFFFALDDCESAFASPSSIFGHMSSPARTVCFAVQFKPNYNPLYLSLAVKEEPEFKVTDVKYTYTGKWLALRQVCAAAFVSVFEFGLLRSTCVVAGFEGY